MEVNQSVNAANLLQVGNLTGKSQSKVNTEKSSDNFTSYLSNAKSNAVSDVNQRHSDVKETPTSSEKKKTESSESTTTEKAELEKTDVARKDEIDNQDMSIASEEEISEDEMTEVFEVVANLLQNVMEQFQLSAEELAGKLEEFGMEMTDLLSEDGLKDFFLNMNSAERSDLLVDEKLNAKLNAFLEEFTDSLQTLDAMETSMNAVVSDKNVDAALMQRLSTFQLEGQSIENQHTENQNLSENVINEPEVIVEKQNGKMDEDKHSFMEQQPKDSETQFETVDSKWKSYDERNNSFENPILQAINDAVNQVEEVVTNNQTVKGTDVIQQIVEQVKVQMSQDSTSLEMQLYPEHLGKIQINVVSKDGVMTAKIVAENEAAKQAIESGLTNLKDAMEQQELKVEAIEVMVSTTGFEQNSEKNDSTAENQMSKGHRKIDLSDGEEEQTQEDAVEEAKMRAIGSSVSFTA